MRAGWLRAAMPGFGGVVTENERAKTRRARFLFFGQRKCAPSRAPAPEGGEEASCRPSLAQKAGFCQEAVNANLKVLFFSRLETDRLPRHLPAEPQNTQPSAHMGETSPAAGRMSKERVPAFDIRRS